MTAGDAGFGAGAGAAEAAGFGASAEAAGAGFGLITGKFTAWIAPVGHSATHFLQSLHLVKSI